MQHWDGLTFGRRHAETYDELTDRPDTATTVACLERLADGGPVLELAIGTGRVGLPLAARGLRVDGVEISPEMVAQLRAKPGGSELAVTVGDMADVPVSGSYRLVYLVYNTLFNLVTQDAQVRCFQRVAEHLLDGGRFVIEAFVPSYLVRRRDHQYVDAQEITVDEVCLDVGRHDPIAQRLDESHVRITEQGIRLYPVVTRYAWPAELDLMGRLAGLELVQRWAGWSGEAFTADSPSHVSVYRRPT
jgi:SAM-dependent methyltransferase